jgi:L-fuculose-phosphate aldolase
LEAVDLGLIKGTSGNIAIREPDGDMVAITPSGVAYKTMKVEDIAIITLNGEWVDGPFKPSSETPMHTAILRARSDVRATVHTHGIFATVMAMLDEELKPTTPPQSEFAPIRTVPFIMPGTEDLAKAVVDTLGDARVVLMQNHGMMCCGKTIKDAMAAATYTEEMAQTAYYAKLLGCFKPLPEESVRQMQALIAADKAV